MKKLWIGLGIVLLAGQVQAQPMRTRFTKENRFPQAGFWELSGGVSYTERLSEIRGWDQPYKVYELTAQARWAPFENLAVYGEAPWISVDDPFGSTERGLGDVALGVEFRPFEEVFGYPWIMPHAEVRLDTGKSALGRGAGEKSVLLGLALGSRMYEVWRLVLDLGYEISEDRSNAAAGAAALIWDLSRVFSLSAEVSIIDRYEGGRYGNRRPVHFLGGMHYQANRHWLLSALGGGGKNTHDDVFVALRAAYSF